MPKTSDSYWVICPYCDHHGIASEWVKAGEPQRVECQTCEREFVCWSELDVTYYTRDTEGGDMLKAAKQGKKESHD